METIKPRPSSMVSSLSKGILYFESLSVAQLIDTEQICDK
jgi:hypothetical protein